MRPIQAYWLIADIDGLYLGHDGWTADWNEARKFQDRESLGEANRLWGSSSTAFAVPVNLLTRQSESGTDFIAVDVIAELGPIEHI